MDDAAFDRALVAAWFALAADQGRRLPSVAAAAREAGLPLDRARVRFAAPASVLMRFGRIADEATLTGLPTDGSVRDKLFDMVMRRIDVLQAHRAGVDAVLRSLPAMPPLALFLAMATERSMRWLLDACGEQTSGIAGALRVRGLVAVWLWTVRAWRTDESADLSTTMAALDRALGQAERAAGWLGGSRATPAAAPPLPEQPVPDPEPPDPGPADPGSTAGGMPTSPADGQPGLEPDSL
jgi:hypothetical protein